MFIRRPQSGVARSWPSSGPRGPGVAPWRCPAASSTATSPCRSDAIGRPLKVTSTIAWFGGSSLKIWTTVEVRATPLTRTVKRLAAGIPSPVASISWSIRTNASLVPTSASLSLANTGAASGRAVGFCAAGPTSVAGRVGPEPLGVAGQRRRRGTRRDVAEAVGQVVGVVDVGRGGESTLGRAERQRRERVGHQVDRTAEAAARQRTVVLLRGGEAPHLRRIIARDGDGQRDRVADHPHPQIKEIAAVPDNLELPVRRPPARGWPRPRCRLSLRPAPQPPLG